MHMVHSIDGLLDCYYCLRGTHWDGPHVGFEDRFLQKWMFLSFEIG